jgi:queuine tRNA-ribosyltransferase
MKKFFKLEKKCSDSKARIGKIHTSHGDIETPFFMPVGTQGTVKTASNTELTDIDVKIFVANTYHLYLRPGVDVISSAGGLHKFIGWDRPILTDSGGYQIYSLATLRKISPDGAEFHSHIDGSIHSFTPERAIEIQTALGADIIMCFDECTPYPCSHNDAKRSLELTLQWAKRCKDKFANSKENNSQALFGIIQGSTYNDLRKQSTMETIKLEFDGYAIGGLSVGEPKDVMFEIIQNTAPYLPEDKPRYAMGVGTPQDIWMCTEQGVDMFDCVLPTRNGRNGQAITSSGKINIRNACYKKDYNRIDSECGCTVCRNYTRAYIHHLFHSGELLALRLLTLHNLNFMIELLGTIRKAVRQDRFQTEKKRFLKKYESNV